ncbi:hypothetical protein pEaSNUABM56_00196 [Erwinia phage pEa_SNUABM_56]|uniref:Uncharacterized protein n=1 Tax=Erwinia phage pEp_SNUABM_01 TaxID=2601643 RepID=A0A5J6DAQ7_9CAUD|nr:hypothetical protein HWC63_gp206 [Erwinia phage pEp_SNUABM_01]QEQ94972.1 hypothetical protein pEpSNUABM01_146 [Erwinia phage pEp_SNUABM_01]UYL84897.1 hypothetical protein pEaSNUABM55_00124 [Erwinia phage pEa_SNUABM_55]UYL85216.1 hypothetical protein pEaSNUABM56_00196 [Erwinia phage pEa_SNUABM_56]
MLLNFRAETYSRLKFLAQKDGKSVAGFVSDLCDKHVEQNVSTNYTLKEENKTHDEGN